MTTPHDPANDPNAVPPVPPLPPRPDEGAHAAAPVDPEQTAPYDAGQTAPYDAGQTVPYDAGQTVPYDAGQTVPYGAPGAAAPYGAPAQTGSPYGGGPYGGAPYGGGVQGPGPDARPKTLALVSLILAAVGTILAVVGFLPFVGLVFSLIGGLVLLVALILSIVALASRKQGGKGLGIAGLVVSVIGGFVAGAAIVVSAFWLALAASTSSSALPEASSAPSATAPEEVLPSDEPGDDAIDGDGDAIAGNEAAYVDDLRPKIRALLKEVQPQATDEQIDAAYSDQVLVMIGRGLLTEYESMGEDAIAAEAKSAAASSGGVFTEEQAERLMRDILDSAQDYLAD